jgi:hypothetical protein
MFSFKIKTDRLLTGIIITVSVAGILYFGIQAILENSKKNQENPFEYNIENFKRSDSSLFHYAEVGQIPVELPNVYGIAIRPDDRIYVSGDSSILVFNKEGSVESIIKTGKTVYCLAFDANRDLYLGMIDHIEVYNDKGLKKSQWKSLGENAIITSIAISNQYVFIADAGNRVIWKFDEKGNLQGKIGEKDEAKDIPGFIIPSPYFDVAVDPDGFLWAANTGRHSLENYTTQGNLRSSWGEFSMEIDGFCGCCNPSHFMVLEDGSFVTSEKGIPRVKVYNRLGNLVSIVAGAIQFDEGTVGLDLAEDSAQRIYVLDPKKKLVRIFDKN